MKGSEILGRRRPY